LPAGYPLDAEWLASRGEKEPPSAEIGKGSTREGKGGLESPSGKVFAWFTQTRLRRSGRTARLKHKYVLIRASPRKVCPMLNGKTKGGGDNLKTGRSAQGVSWERENRRRMRGRIKNSVRRSCRGKGKTPRHLLATERAVRALSVPLRRLRAGERGQIGAARAKNNL